MLTHGSLFAGIGGFDLGFERAGIKTIWQVEIDEYCRRVLARHFPDAERFSDVRECVEFPPCDIITGGFPCQDISLIGRRAGISGERSGLYREMVRAIRLVRPKRAVVENVAALLGDGMGTLCGDLAEIGYDSEWDCLPAAAFGAPHIRDRFFMVANPNRQQHQVGSSAEWRPTAADISANPAILAERESSTQANPITGSRKARTFIGGGTWWSAEPGVRGVAYGVSGQVDRISGLGNAVVPQITEWIGRRIVEATI